MTNFSYCSLTSFIFLLLMSLSPAFANGADHLVFVGENGPGKGKHVVFLAGDEEYRSEEAMPLMAQILSKQGFKCTVLFSINEKTGTVDPNNRQSLTHPQALDSADALVMSIRFRNWPDAIMQKFEDAIHRGVALIGLRTTTHAFRFPKNSKWFKYSFNATEKSGWHKGFGREIMGETWVNHHGKHKVEGTRSFIEVDNKEHEILRSVGTIFGTTDVYGAKPDTSRATILVRGGVTKTLDPDSPLLAGPKNNPMQPIAWVRQYKNSHGTVNRVFTTTMGAATDLASEHLRRLVGNSVFWGLELAVPVKLDVSLPGDYKPTNYGFNKFRKGLKPEDFVLQKSAPADSPNKGPEGSQILPIPGKIKLAKDARIVLIGGNLGARMMHYGFFETELHLRHPDKNLYIRNMCDGGDTPGFRPHSARNPDKHFAFPGAEKFYPQFKKGAGKGFNETPDEWIGRHQADIIIAFFGYSESFKGPSGLESYAAELEAFIDHTLSQKYNGRSAPQLVLVSPIAFQDLSAKYDYPDGQKENMNLAMYTEVMKSVALSKGVHFVDTFTPTKEWYANGRELTIDGSQLNSEGYRKFATFLVDAVFTESKVVNEERRQSVMDAVLDKNWYWHNDYKIPNGVHVFGRRYKPFGPDNYPEEIEKIRQLTAIRDRAIRSAVRGESFDIAAADRQTTTLTPVKTNYKAGVKTGGEYLPGPKSAQQLKVARGYKMELFASEKEFKDLANPVQMSFDNKGRLWVAVMPSYPHWKPGDGKPNDKLIILEDTDGDGIADKQTTFADKLNLPIGFEFVPEGVYVSQGTNLVLLKDTDGDDQADVKEIIFSGFDDHDTHHAISAFCADPSGSLLMAEGIFLSTHVETSYGTVRGTDGGFYRFNPIRRQLERTAQLRIPNPWGIAFDDWGQTFFLHTSGPSFSWMDPSRTKPTYGHNSRTRDLLEKKHRVRPTSGLEFVSSRHFPPEVQGDILICNNIGFKGAKQHEIIEDGTGFKTKFRHDLFQSTDGNFRPVDLEFAPDGSLYVIDWHNKLIGHMQHNARDPERDHSHGRIYRITYPGQALVKPAKVAGATIAELLENLKLPEYRTRYRSRRELRGRQASELIPAVRQWVKGLDKAAKNYEKNLLEALWVTWGVNDVDEPLLTQCLSAKDHRVRAAAVNVLRYSKHKVKSYPALMLKAAQDSHGRVRNGAIVAASWMEKKDGLAVLSAAKNTKRKMGHWNKSSYEAALNALQNKTSAVVQEVVKTHLSGADKELFIAGKEIYEREGHCITCHQQDGQGLVASGFPPLVNTKWVLGNEERLIKLTLKGLLGPMEVQGQKYPGLVPMTPFEGMLSDRDIAAVLTYVRNSFGNKAPVISAASVKKVRAAVKDKTGFYTPEELLKMHP